MNVKLLRPYFSAAFLFLGLAFLTVGCEKPEEEIGINLQPDEDILNVAVIDTFSILSYTLEEDSLRSDKLNPALVGAYIDPVFGLAEAKHVTELRLSTSSPDLLPSGNVDDIVVDSIILALDYQYGLDDINHYDGTGAQYFQVFQVLDSLSVDSAYYDVTEVELDPEDLVKEGMNLIKPNFQDSVTVGEVRLAPQLRIPLKESFANQIFEAAVDGPITPEEFVSLVKGISIQVDPNQQNLNNSGIIYFDTFNEGSSLTMYYRDLSGGPEDVDTLAYTFDIRSNTGKYGHFEQEYTFAERSLFYQTRGERSFGQKDLYVQAMAGTKVRVEIPHLENLKDSTNFAINKAELILPIRSGTTGRHVPPGRIFIFGLDEEERIYIIDDQLDSGVDGFYDDENQQYRFLITRQVQQILLGQRDNYGFELVTWRAANSANRVILNGPDYPSAENPSNNLRLTLTYTKF